MLELVAELLRGAPRLVHAVAVAVLAAPSFGAKES